MEDDATLVQPVQEQSQKKLKKLKDERKEKILKQIKDANDDAHIEEHRYDDINNAMDAYLRHAMNFLGWQESEAYAIAWLVLCEVSGCYFPVTKCSIMRAVYRAFRLLVNFPSETVQISSIWIFYWLKLMAITKDSFLIYEATKAFKKIIKYAYEKQAPWFIEFTKNATITIDTDIQFLKIAEAALCTVLKHEKSPCVAQRINRETKDIHGRIVARLRDYLITGGTLAKAGVTRALKSLQVIASKVKRHSANKNDSLLQNEFSNYTKLKTMEEPGAAIKEIVNDSYISGHCARTLCTVCKVANDENKDLLEKYAPEFAVFCNEECGVGSAPLMEMSDSLDDSLDKKYRALGVPDPKITNSAATLIAKLDTAIEMLLPTAIAKKYHDENRKRTVDSLANLTCMCLRGKTPGKTPDKEDVLALYKKLFDRNFEDDTYGWRRKYLSKVLATDTEEQEYILNYLSNESRSFGCVLGVPASSSCYQTLPILPQTPNFAETLRSAQQYLGLHHYIAKLDTAIEMLLPTAIAKKYHDENRKRTVDSLANLTCMCLRGKAPDKEDVLTLYKKLFDRNFEDDTYAWRYTHLSKVLDTDAEGQEFILNFLSEESRSFGCVLGVSTSRTCYQTLPRLTQTPNFAEALRSAQQYLGLSPLQQFLELPQSFEQLYAMSIINTAVVRGMPKQKEPKSLRDVPALIQKKEISLPEQCVYLVHVRTAEEQAIAERRVDPSNEKIKKQASMVDTIGKIREFTPLQMQQDSSLLVIRAIRLAIRNRKQERHAKKKRICKEKQNRKKFKAAS
eukprot:CAMPEP_0197323168 /NCGR_PEP_ID=MMETSP0891-20130614/70351_1 /TAXON_ID=44058 ORGANISM="Aureoumbra lagunensis, Strain CCMP1510" /NCGR_SAMPLE_ID=MMETSP0891 /ASSEMBLY_ACC=CAM_ASM_000534 /LENGTH=792 /DNA_ID=CAMNT_0042815745 /DNA_START=463 /DNA_END=2842 /DNA_ORIENTATION=-